MTTLVLEKLAGATVTKNMHNVDLISLVQKVMESKLRGIRTAVVVKEVPNHCDCSGRWIHFSLLVNCM